MKTRTWLLAPLLVVACSSQLATETFDCAACPAMIEIPGGRFLMGTAEADRLIDPRTGKPAKNDSPQHPVDIEAFALGKHEVTVAQYRAFIAATGHENSGNCMGFGSEDGRPRTDGVSWDSPGFAQADNAPVSCVSFFDAQAYTNWLSEMTGKPYRLPTEAEWEYAARAGSTTPYHWGTVAGQACDYANIRSPGAVSISQRQTDSDKADGFPCEDGEPGVSSVGGYRPNDFGLYDMQGNAWEWVADCNHKDYVGAPGDGSAWLDDAPCRFGIIRGGSYLNRVERSSTAVRVGRPRSGAGTNMGFRVARGGAQPAGATTEAYGSTASAASDDSTGAQLFDENCADCHIDSNNFLGLYGKDQASLVTTIRDGGNNIMSMPAFGNMLTDDEIDALVRYVRRANGW